MSRGNPMHPWLRLHPSCHERETIVKVVGSADADASIAWHAEDNVKRAHTKTRNLAWTTAAFMFTTILIRGMWFCSSWTTTHVRPYGDVVNRCQGGCQLIIGKDRTHVLRISRRWGTNHNLGSTAQEHTHSTTMPHVVNISRVGGRQKYSNRGCCAWF